MSAKTHTLDVGTLLAKNPKAAKTFKSNQKKLAKARTKGRRARTRKEYGLGLPYERLLASSASEPAVRSMRVKKPELV